MIEYLRAVLVLVCFLISHRGLLCFLCLNIKQAHNSNEPVSRWGSSAKSSNTGQVAVCPCCVCCDIPLGNDAASSACRFDVCDGGKVASAFLESHACPTLPDAGGAKGESRHQASQQSGGVQHTDKVHSQLHELIHGYQDADRFACWIHTAHAPLFGAGVEKQVCIFEASQHAGLVVDGISAW